LAKLIQAGVTVRLDAGRANGKLFLVMASCGFDADVVKRLHAGRRGHIRHWSYAWPIMSAIGQYQYPRIRMWVDEESQPISARWAFLFNVPRYAMNLPIMTDANSMDGRLDLCTFRGGNLMRGLYYLLAILTQQHRSWDESHCCRFRRLKIESDGLVPYQLDGDPGGELPLEIEVQPGFLRVVVDGAWIGENGR
jgi:diacylglycerol kinase family enzyme